MKFYFLKIVENKKKKERKEIIIKIGFSAKYIFLKNQFLTKCVFSNTIVPHKLNFK